MTATVPTDPAEAELAARVPEIVSRLRTELAKAIVGQADVVEEVLLALLCRGHCLIEGVPGLAKTVLVQSLGRCLDLSVARIQFTPDLMPADITGTDLIQEDPVTGRRQFEFAPGPLFAGLVLADEINRCPPKTQAALLEAMQERRVTVRGRTYELPDPFCVLATQNPIEQEGTYPLPEAQLDRFTFLVRIGYPSAADEVAILERTTGVPPPPPTRVLSGRDLLAMQELVRRVPVPPQALEHAAARVRATRPQGGHADAARWLQWGAGPRAGQVLVLAAKARALLAGRFHVATTDIDAVALPALRHRVVLAFAAQAEGLDVDTVLGRILADG